MCTNSNRLGGCQCSKTRSTGASCVRSMHAKRDDCIRLAIWCTYLLCWQLLICTAQQLPAGNSNTAAAKQEPQLAGLTEGTELTRSSNSMKQHLRGQHYNNPDAGAARTPQTRAALQQQLMQRQLARSPSTTSLDLQMSSWRQQHQGQVHHADSQGETLSGSGEALMSTMQHAALEVVHAARAPGSEKGAQLPSDLHTHASELRTHQLQGQQDAWLDLRREDITSWRKLQSEHAQSAQQQLTMQGSQQLRLVQDSLFEAPAVPQPGPDQQGSALLWALSQQQSQQGTTSQADLPADTEELSFAAAPAAQEHTAQHAALALSSSAQSKPHNHLAATTSVGEWPPVPPAAPTPSSTDLPSRHQRVEVDFMSEDDYSMVFTGFSSKHQQGYMVGASDTSIAAEAAAYGQNPEGAGYTGATSTGLTGVDAASDDMAADVRE